MGKAKANSFAPTKREGMFTGLVSPTKPWALWDCSSFTQASDPLLSLSLPRTGAELKPSHFPWGQKASSVLPHIHLQTHSVGRASVGCKVRGL